jgi:3-oxoacyl-[acyl-carrier-protein] synthase-3
MANYAGIPVSIRGTGRFLPERVMTNAELEVLVETSDQWIRERTGIRERRIAAEGQNTSDLAAGAGRIALADAGISPEELDMIIVATNSPDTIFPAVSAKAQGLLGATRSGATDLQSGCTSSVYALAMGTSGVASGLWRNVLVVGAEVLSRFIDWGDRNTCVLFGDGAGAVLLAPAAPGEGRILSADLKSDGTRHEYITLPASGTELPASAETVAGNLHKVHMKGNEVFKFVNRLLPTYLEEFCVSSGIQPGQVDWWIFHQANLRIMEGVLRRFGIAEERTLINLDRYGNTSSASVFLVLDEARRDGRIRPGQKVVISSFGAGMTWGALLYEA